MSGMKTHVGRQRVPSLSVVIGLINQTLPRTGLLVHSTTSPFIRFKQNSQLRVYRQSIQKSSVLRRYQQLRPIKEQLGLEKHKQLQVKQQLPAVRPQRLTQHNNMRLPVSNTTQQTASWSNTNLAQVLWYLILYALYKECAYFQIYYTFVMPFGTTVRRMHFNLNSMCI
jgi:hypothetical protein